MYSVLDYGRMAMDPVRMDAYARAIARAVKPGSVVVDIGAGTGIFSLLAAQAGAAHVHAIEPNPAVSLLHELARENGVADRVTIHACPSYEVDLTQRADVVVSDLRGSFPVHAEHLPAIRDARARLLRPGGTLVPQRDRLFVALVEADALWRKLEAGWMAFERQGLAAKATRMSVLNSVFTDAPASIPSSDVLSEPAVWTEIDYRTSDADMFSGTVEVPCVRRGEAHGLALWFEATILDDIAFSTAPGSNVVYARTFLPLLEPVRVENGDRAEVTLRVDTRGTRWAWDTRISRAGRALHSFRQATFFGMATDSAALVRESTSHRPKRSARGDRALRILESMDGERSVGDLAAVARDLMPAESPARAGVLDEVRDLVGRYAR